MLTCVTCSAQKDETDFHWKNRGRGVRKRTCATCCNAQTRSHYSGNVSYYTKKAKKRATKIRAEVRRKVWDYLLSHPCVDCGEKNPLALEFDHVDGKEADVSRLVSDGYGWERVSREIGRCVVRCSNCHQIKTAVERGSLLFLDLFEKGVVSDKGRLRVGVRSSAG